MDETSLVLTRKIICHRRGFVGRFHRRSLQISFFTCIHDITSHAYFIWTIENERVVTKSPRIILILRLIHVGWGFYISSLFDVHDPDTVFFKRTLLLLLPFLFFFLLANPAMYV